MNLNVIGDEYEYVAAWQPFIRWKIKYIWFQSICYLMSSVERRDCAGVHVWSDVWSAHPASLYDEQRMETIIFLVNQGSLQAGAAIQVPSH